MTKIAALTLALAACASAFASPENACSAQTPCALEQAQFDQAYQKWRLERVEIQRDSEAFERRASSLLERSKALPVGARPGSLAGEALRSARVQALGREGPLMELFELDSAWGGDGRSATLAVRSLYRSSSLFQASGRVYGWAGEERLNRDEQLPRAMPELIAALQAALPPQWVVSPAGSERVLISWPAIPLAKAGDLWDQWAALERDYALEKQAFSRRQKRACERLEAHEEAMARLRPLTWRQRLAATPAESAAPRPRRLASPSASSLDEKTPRLILSSF